MKSVMWMLGLAFLAPQSPLTLAGHVASGAKKVSLVFVGRQPQV
jgi:hypothetical protein